ncbi:DUF1660 family phage protein [Ruegeria arenilitoris]
MKRIFCRIFGHKWRVRWASTYPFHHCLRCGVGGDIHCNEVH